MSGAPLPYPRIGQRDDKREVIVNVELKEPRASRSDEGRVEEPRPSHLEILLMLEDHGEVKEEPLGRRGGTVTVTYRHGRAPQEHWS